MISPHKISTLSDLIYWTTMNREDQIFNILDHLPDKDLQSLRVSVDLLSNTLDQSLDERYKNSSMQMHLGI